MQLSHSDPSSNTMSKIPNCYRVISKSLEYMLKSTDQTFLMLSTFYKINSSQTWWHMPLNPAFGMLRQDCHESETSNIVSFCHWTLVNPSSCTTLARPLSQKVILTVNLLWLRMWLSGRDTCLACMGPLGSILSTTKKKVY